MLRDMQLLCMEINDNLDAVLFHVKQLSDNETFIIFVEQQS